ncbi:phosphonoacetaldehyde hydrolase [Marinobacter daepoensis]|uniref:Phosphonoacetaldehyde hydrolase n=1 Tax=Marinobacter daepoensis TaxID=262077 RepID=A0ABS3BEQ0_9GAMM|nr:phosphonoacetaldehyde hydrolase [Marinobacter daepoensis]MBN7769795.1 phosphonoacetaldehyde hydrolase [Marinobacter daepoensis]MBY6031572.1 phosphonoacetaldehyde hydrolase [Marinobacter daepoensis]MBY6078485.1 phosphonoacetaldehyde hydrolase [Marinobacter daepoensis]
MYTYTRRYTGPLQAVIMDLAGTCVDFGSLAPIQAFLNLFESEGIELSEAEAREPMGTEKREHIRRLLAMPRIRNQWHSRHGQMPGSDDIDRLYQAFLPLQTAAIAERTKLIPGAIALRDLLQEHDIRLGVNTGYSREMVNVMLPGLAGQGFEPESVVVATEVPQGRPAPHMSLKNALELGVGAVQACVKVDDTATGIEEGLNAGMWTVAVVASGNAVGLSEEQFTALECEEKEAILARGYAEMAKSGAHYVIDSIEYLPEVLEDIERRLAEGECP